MFGTESPCACGRLDLRPNRVTIKLIEKTRTISAVSASFRRWTSRRFKHLSELTKHLLESSMPRQLVVIVRRLRKHILFEKCEPLGSGMAHDLAVSRLQ